MPELRRSRWNDRGLWSAVVLQAIADIESQPTQSATFAEAVAFFTRSGAWAESRTMIGDFLGLHRDNLEAIGKRCIDARNAREASTREVRPRNVLGMTPLKLARQVERRGDVRPSALHGPGPRTLPSAPQPDWAADRLLPNLDRSHGDHRRL
jgi:hypothetical protein